MIKIINGFLTQANKINIPNKYMAHTIDYEMGNPNKYKAHTNDYEMGNPNKYIPTPLTMR